jgi:hypothetical protein
MALASLLLFGRWAWPGIFLGAFLANVTTAGTITTSPGIATGNTLEAVLGVLLINGFAGGRDVFARAEWIFRYVVLAALGATMVSATVGVTVLADVLVAVGEICSSAVQHAYGLEDCGQGCCRAHAARDRPSTWTIGRRRAPRVARSRDVSLDRGIRSGRRTSR